MINSKDKILFFASGDFAIPTFLDMLDKGYSIVGVVTSDDRCHFNELHISDYAREKGIPFVIVNDKTLNDENTLLFIKSCNADIFCVISFKFLSDKILSLANKTAFNVHASILPFLKGAAPINWAIRLGFKETGLTAFVLDDKIDNGDILCSVYENIEKDDTYEKLFKRLALKCVKFTESVVDNILTKPDFIENAIKQSDFENYCMDSTGFFAPKINREYFRIYKQYPPFDIEALCRSVYPIEGMPSVILIKDNKGNMVKKINCKIFSVTSCGCVSNIGNSSIDSPNVYSDKKTYLNVIDNSYTNQMYKINEIQLEGRKRLSIRDFLKGFQYIKDNDKYRVTIKFCSYKEDWSFNYSFDEYIKRVKDLLKENFNYTEKQIDGNLSYFKQMYKNMTNPNTALEMFYYKLKEKTDNGI